MRHLYIVESGDTSGLTFAAAILAPSRGCARAVFTREGDLPFTYPLRITLMRKNFDTADRGCWMASNGEYPEIWAAYNQRREKA